MSVKPEPRPRKSVTRTKRAWTVILRVIVRIDVQAIVLALLAVPAIMRTFTL